MTQLRVRYAETDQMGLVHHSHYATYFEAGRTEFFLEHALPYHEFERKGLYAPVTELRVDLHGRAGYGDVLVLETRPLWLRGVRLAMGYVITRQGDGGGVARGETTHALLGSDFKPAHPRRFGELYAVLQRIFPR